MCERVSEFVSVFITHLSSCNTYVTSCRSLNFVGQVLEGSHCPCPGPWKHIGSTHVLVPAYPCGSTVNITYVITRGWRQAAMYFPPGPQCLPSQPISVSYAVITVIMQRCRIRGLHCKQNKFTAVMALRLEPTAFCEACRLDVTSAGVRYIHAMTYKLHHLLAAL